jgi:hypothetical protein
MLFIAITMLPIYSNSDSFHSKIENSIKFNVRDQPLPTYEEFLLRKSTSKKRQNHKNSVERYRQFERKALKEKFGGDLGSCLSKHESTLVKEQILENEFPKFLLQTNSVKETKRKQTDELLKSFGGDLNISLKRHESLLERDKRLAKEEESIKYPETPLSTSRRLQSELDLMDKFGGELGSILQKHECGLERDIRLARESAAANPGSSYSSQEFSSSHSDDEDQYSGFSPLAGSAPRSRASSASPLLAAEEPKVDSEHGAEGQSGENYEDAEYRQEPALSDEEYEHGAAADDGGWCAPAPGM